MEKILVIPPTEAATKATVSLLFRPFNKKIWLTLALAAALTLIGETSSIDFLLHLLASVLEESLTTIHLSTMLPSLDDAAKWLPQHTTLFILYLLAITLPATAIYLLYRYLNSRGQFILLDHAAHNNIPFKQSWRTHKTLARSLFKLRIYWDLLLFNAFLAVAIIALLLALPDWKPLFSGNPYFFSGWSLTTLIFAFLLTTILSLLIWILNSLLHYLVIPAMYLHHTAAWPTFKSTYKKIFRPHLKQCLAYFLIMFLTNNIARLLTFLAILPLTLLTCGIGFILALIPLLGLLTLYPLALAALPILLWQRAYMLNFLQQFPPQSP